MTRSLSILEAGARVGVYAIETLLGQGGFGVVYRARDRVGRAVALKLSHVSFADLPSRELVWQQNEVEVLLRLEHPSIVTVFDHGWLPDGRLYLAMELVEGQTLYDWIYTEGRLDPLEALRIAQRITEGLVHSHGEGILHLDLKPANIVVIDRHVPRIKILDFGLAHLTEAWRSSRESTPGTPEFMPPEVFTEVEVTPDTSFDLYALGTTLYEMLAARLPFTAHEANDLATLKARGLYQPLRTLNPAVPEELAMLIAMLMAHRREDRPASAAQLQEVLRSQIYALLGGNTLSVDLPITGAVRPAAPMKAGVPAAETAFVGRRRELDALDRHWQRALRAPAPGLVVLAPGGVGKSRLVATFLDRFGPEDAILGYGRCREIAGQIPHAAVREALGRIAEGLGALADHDQIRVANALTELRTDVTVLSSLVPEAAGVVNRRDGLDDLTGLTLESTERVARAVHGLLCATATTIPTMLVIEDLHWADEATLEVVRRLLELGTPAGCLVLATARPEPVVEALEGLVALALEPLDEADNDEHLAALLGHPTDALLATLKARVPMLAAGNPLFNAQVVRDMELEGAIARAADGALQPTAALTDYTPPDSVFDIVERSLHRLPERATTILGVAALLGRRFRIDDLRAIELFDDDELRTAIDDARHLGLVHGAPRGYAFTHDLIRTHIEAAIDPDLLPEVHARIARALQARGAPASERAQHLDRAGDAWRAARAWLEAGLYADVYLDPRGAVRHLRRAHALLVEQPSSPERDALLVRATFELARIAPGLGDTEDLLRAVHQAATTTHLAPGSEAAVGLDSAAALIHYVRGDLDAVISHCRRAMPARPDTELGRRYLLSPTNIMGRALCASGQFRAASSLLERGCRLAEDSHAWLELAHSRGMLALARGFLGRIDEARELAVSAHQLAEQLGDPVRRVATLVYRAIVAEVTFDWAGGLRLSVEAMHLAEQHGLSGLYVYLATLMAGRHQFHFGHFDRARVLLSQALNMAREHSVNMARGWAFAFLGDVHFVLGQYDAAWRAYRAGLALSLDLGDELGVPMSRLGLAHCHAATDRDAVEVDRQAVAAIDQLESVPNPRILIDALARYADCLQRLDKPAEAREVLARRGWIFASLGLDESSWWPEPPSRDFPVSGLDDDALTGTTPRPPSTRPHSLHSRPPLEEAALSPGDTVQEIARAATEVLSRTQAATAAPGPTTPGVTDS